MSASRGFRVVEVWLVGRKALCVTLLGALAGCAGGGDATGTDGEPPCCISLSIPNMMLFVVQGSSTNIPVTLTRSNNYTAAVVLSVDSIPSGVTATFDPPSLSGNTFTSTLTITAAVDAPRASGRSFFFHGETSDSVRAYAGGILSVLMPRVNVSLTGTGAGTVTSSPAGINCGTACSAEFPYDSNVTLTATPNANSAFAGWSGGCTNSAGPCTIKARGVTAVTAVFNSTAPGFSFVVTPTIVSVAQGGSGTATVNIARLNGFAGDVNLVVSGAPSGLSITPNPAMVSGTSATLSIAAALSVGVSNYPLTITATGTSVAQQTAALNVQVTPAPGGTSNITLSLGNCDAAEVPIWFAAQDGNGAWTKIPQGANNAFTFAIANTGAFAYVTRHGPDVSTRVIYLTAAEARSIALGSLCAITPQSGTKGLTGMVAGVGPPAFWTLAIGGAGLRVDGIGGPSQPFTIGGVPDGARDLIAARVAPSANMPGVNAIQRIILRRNTNYPNGSGIPRLDFNGPEAVTPAAHFILLNNLGSETIGIDESLFTANGATAAFFTSAGGVIPAINATGVRYFPLPDSLLQPGDLHALAIHAGSGTSSRFAILYLRRPAGDTTVNFGPPLSTPTVTSLGTTPYLRLRALLPSQSAYNGGTSFELTQNTRDVEVFTTTAYLGGTPAAWTVDVPDLSGAGYDASWGLATGGQVTWTLVAVGGNALPFIGAMPLDGARIIGAAISNTSTAFGPATR